MSASVTTASRRSQLGIAGSLWTLTAAAGAYEISPASITPVLVDGLGVDTTAVSWLVSVMFATAVVMSIPSGIIIGRLSAKRAVVLSGLGLVVAGVFGWYFAARGWYGPLVATRVLGGIAFVLVWNAGLDIFSQFEFRATATGIFTASGPGGFAVGHLTAAPIANFARWEYIFLLYPLAALGPLVVFAACCPADVGSTKGELPTLSRLVTPLQNSQFRLICILGFAAYSLYLFANSWLPGYAASELGFSLTRSGILIAVFPLIGVLSRTTGGYVTDQLFGGDRRRVVFLSFLITTPAIFIFQFGQSFRVLLLTLIVAGFFVQL